jgi:hypothetical protein
MTIDRQQLSGGHDVFGSAGHRFPVDGDTRIRPASGCDDIGSFEVDGRADRADARALGR